MLRAGHTTIFHVRSLFHCKFHRNSLVSFFAEPSWLAQESPRKNNFLSTSLFSSFQSISPEKCRFSSDSCLYYYDCVVSLHLSLSEEAHKSYSQKLFLRKLRRRANVRSLMFWLKIFAWRFTFFRSRRFWLIFSPPCTQSSHTSIALSPTWHQKNP